MNEIKCIEFPNTLSSGFTSHYLPAPTYSFKIIQKNNETWIQIYKHDCLYAEIKESVCNIFYQW